MKWLGFWWELAAGVSLILVVNATFLGLVLWNRSGKPEAALELTENELSLSRLDDNRGDDTGLVLHLEWRDATRWRWNAGEVDQEQLAKLGFDASLPPEAPSAIVHYSRQPPHRAFLVLEQDGDAWRRWLSDRAVEVERLRAKVATGELSPEEFVRLTDELKAAPQTSSRLMVIDGGMDAEALRTAYPDRNRHAVVAGVVRLSVSAPQGEELQFQVTVEKLEIAEIHVPLRLKSVPEAALLQNRARSTELAERYPRYLASVAFGRAAEPWLVNIKWIGRGEVGR